MNSYVVSATLNWINMVWKTSMNLLRLASYYNRSIGPIQILSVFEERVLFLNNLIFSNCSLKKTLRLYKVFEEAYFTKIDFLTKIDFEFFDREENHLNVMCLSRVCGCCKPILWNCLIFFFLVLNYSNFDDISASRWKSELFYSGSVCILAHLLKLKTLKRSPIELGLSATLGCVSRMLMLICFIPWV
jgi:hypothetical protein